MIKSLRNKGLRRFAEKGDASKLSVQNADRVRRILAFLEDASSPRQTDQPGLFFHALHGGRYSVRVTGNWRITFAWEGADAIDVDLEGLPLMILNPLLAGLRPTHPGEILRKDILPALGRPKAEIARLLGISRRSLYDILEEKSPITPQMALRIAKLIGADADHWLRLQMTYDLKVAEKAMAGELAKIPRLEAKKAA